MADYKFNLKKLCTPASIYFVISMIAFLVLLVQNLGGDSSVLCVGDYKCDIGSVFMSLVVNLLYIVFWTFVLDLMCKNGYEKISWLLVLLPILLFFVSLTVIMLYYPVA
tara:strand:+ start:3527 stop:3853 length:327 start_codon:yes stop_codon:yes gene_type:complete